MSIKHRIVYVILLQPTEQYVTTQANRLRSKLRKLLRGHCAGCPCARCSSPEGYPHVRCICLDYKCEILCLYIMYECMNTFNDIYFYDIEKVNMRCMHIYIHTPHQKDPRGTVDG